MKPAFYLHESSLLEDIIDDLKEMGGYFWQLYKIVCTWVVSMFLILAIIHYFGV